MSVRIWQSCDMVLSNLTKLKVSPPYTCSTVNKPANETITLDGAIAVNDIQITVDSPGLTFDVPKNTEITFGSVVVITSSDYTAGGLTFDILPASAIIADNATATVSPLFEVYSANEASHTINENEVTDRVFGAGVWTTSKLTSRSAEVSVNGVRIKDDPGLVNVMNAAKTLNRVYFEVIEPDGVTGIEGWGNVKGLNIQRQIDNNEQISFTIGVDGELKDYTP